MLQSLKTNLLLLWRGDRIWIILNLLVVPLIFVFLAFGAKSFVVYALGLGLLLFFIDYTFIVCTQAMDVNELLVFPHSHKNKYKQLLMQSALGIKLPLALIFIITLFIFHPETTHPVMALQLAVLYLLYCMFFTNFMLLVKRRKIYSVLMKHVIFIFFYFPVMVSSLPELNEIYTRIHTHFISYWPVVTLALLIILPLFYFLNLKWFTHILYKKPFYDMEVILKHNRKKIGF